MRKLGWGVCLTIIFMILMAKIGPFGIPSMKIPGYIAKEYIEVGTAYQIPWTYLAAMDEVEHRYQKSSRVSIEKRAKKIREQLEKSHKIDKVVYRLYPLEQAKQIIRIAASYQWGAPMLGENYQFPFRMQDRKKLTYQDTWGARRTYGGKRKHEGTDLMTKKGIPLLAVTDGIILNKGWNRLGGWRISLLDIQHPQIVYYYAHLKEFPPQLKVGSFVDKGEIIGFVGDSGYGKEGTTGKFPPHLHFGIYVREGWFNLSSQAINPYPFLKVWDPLNR